MFTINYTYTRSVKAAAGLCALALCLAISSTAFAHQEKEVGDYMLAVGFRVEPAVENQMNGMELFAETKAGQKLEGLEKTLKMDVTTGGQTRTFEMYPAWQDPGHYLTDFMPTAVGDYQVRLYGTINDTAIDEMFESGPDRFSPIEPVASLQFPNKLATTEDMMKMVQAADAKATQAQTFGLIGIVIAIIALVVGAVVRYRGKA